ncbi:hypothetical protein SAMN05880590_10915 [Rhizobium sp. RU35A]|uniref:hypothetical protein n=1 Tax=Rhizobium sp. RU35A TaxID=1907414 RepID=UPI000956DD6C|nr:hypothetical protein [Rhizobium sp. RU35A]SIQ92643.1 hypothetical protein SAMN05880590_10915 [Rhizobium sp. RU35A]
MPVADTFHFDNVVNIAAIIALVTFFLKYVIDGYIGRRRNIRERRKMILALYTEVKLNVDNLREDGGQIDFHDIAGFLAASPQNAPHIVVFYYSDIYKSKFNTLSDLPDVLIKNIVQFYGELEYIGLLAASLTKPSFQVVSQRAREATIMELQKALAEALSGGTKLLGAFDLIMPRAPHRE